MKSLAGSVETRSQVQSSQRVTHCGSLWSLTVKITKQDSELLGKFKNKSQKVKQHFYYLKSCLSLPLALKSFLRLWFPVSVKKWFWIKNYMKEKPWIVSRKLVQDYFPDTLKIDNSLLLSNHALAVNCREYGYKIKISFHLLIFFNLLKLSGCGGLVTGLKGSFHSPNFPGKYPPEKTCSWKISVPEGYIIQMKFIRFHLEKHSICKYDSVVIKDGWERKSPLLGRYCDVNPARGKFLVLARAART